MRHLATIREIASLRPIEGADRIEVAQVDGWECDALGNYSEEWKYIVDHYFMPKCKLMGFCSEKKTCGMMPRKQ